LHQLTGKGLLVPVRDERGYVYANPNLSKHERQKSNIAQFARSARRPKALAVKERAAA
jgi:hypothetical protein